VYGGTRRLRPHEQDLLDRAAAALDAAEGDILMQQIRAITLMQRFSQVTDRLEHGRS
jgi:hypothetical protein